MMRFFKILLFLTAMAPFASARASVALENYVLNLAYISGPVGSIAGDSLLEVSSRAIVTDRFSTSAAKTQAVLSGGDRRVEAASFEYDPGQILRNVETLASIGLGELPTTLATARFKNALDSRHTSDFLVAFGTVDVANQGTKRREIMMFTRTERERLVDLLDTIDPAAYRILLEVEDVWHTTPDGSPGLVTASSHFCAISFEDDASLADANCLLGMANTDPAHMKAAYTRLARSLDFAGLSMSESIRFEFPRPGEHSPRAGRPFTLTLPTDEHGRNPLAGIIRGLENEYRFLRVEGRDTPEYRAAFQY